MKRYRDKRKPILPSKRGLILCEGETEENYFTGLISQERYRRKFSSIEIDIYTPTDYSPLGLVKEAKRKIKQAKRENNSFDFVWVVFDKDRHENIPEAFDQARKSNPQIHIAFSIICFEFYVLLHFVQTTRPFDRCDDVGREVRRYLPDYEKASNLFTILESRMEDGLCNSEWCCSCCQLDLERGIKPYDLSAYTDVHKLVRYLLSLIL